MSNDQSVIHFIIRFLFFSCCLFLVMRLLFCFCLVCFYCSVSRFPFPLFRLVLLSYISSSPTAISYLAIRNAIIPSKQLSSIFPSRCFSLAWIAYKQHHHPHTKHSINAINGYHKKKLWHFDQNVYDKGQPIVHYLHSYLNICTVNLFISITLPS